MSLVEHERDTTTAARGGFVIPLAYCAGLQVLALTGAIGWLMAGPAELWTSPRRYAGSRRPVA